MIVGADGWTVDPGQLICDAIIDLNTHNRITRDRANTLARAIVQAHEAAAELDRPNSRPTTDRASEREVEGFCRLTTALLDALEEMHQPALAALASEGVSIGPFRELLVEVDERSKYAMRAAFEGSSSTGSRPKKVAASEVTDWAAFAYQEVTGENPTITTDPGNSAVGGRWIVFLGQVFSALYLDASVESQARAYIARKKSLQI